LSSVYKTPAYCNLLTSSSLSLAHTQKRKEKEKEKKEKNVRLGQRNLEKEH